MKKILIIILIFVGIIGICLIPKLNKQEKISKTNDLKIGEEINVSLNDENNLSFYILEINDDVLTLIIKDSLEKIKCEDETCDVLTRKIEELKNSWTNTSDVRLIKSADILSEEDLNIESDSICTRLESYLNPDTDGYYLENIKTNTYGYVKGKDNNCVEINFEKVTGKEYSLKPVVMIHKKYITK